MTQYEFVLSYVGVPLAVALVWLLWRARYFLRNAILYALAVAALLGVIRLGGVIRHAWDWGLSAPPAAEIAPPCIDSPLRGAGTDSPACWT